MNTVKIFLALLLLILLHAVAIAQIETAGPEWVVTRFDITANVASGERALTARAVLTAKNVGRASGSTFSVRLNPKAEVKSASVNDSPAIVRTRTDTRGDLLLATISLPAPVAQDSSIKVSIDYRLPVEENNGLAAITPLGSQFLPLSFWYPTPNTPFSIRGGDSAPIHLNMNSSEGETLVSSGQSSGSSFDLLLNGQPFFVKGSWDISEGRNDARGISAYMPKGAGADERKQAESLIALAAAARTFFANTLGNAPDAPIRLVAVTRGAGFNDSGTVLLDAAAFRRSKIDSATALLVAETVARLWVGGVAPVRGEGGGVVREGLIRFLATAFIEKQFGADAAAAERMRERIAYAAVSRRDAPLRQATILDETYFTSVGNKGAMVWRLVDRALGRDVFMSVLKSQIQAGSNSAAGMSLNSLRAALADRGGASLKTILDQELDQTTDTDLMIGLPVQRGSQWVSALRNLGQLDVTVTVLGTTESGQSVTTQATVPGRNFGEAVFNTSSRIVRAEIDPEKLYPQMDYSNDVQPRAKLPEEALSEITQQFARQEFAHAEANARAALAYQPRMQDVHLALARALLAQNKTDEAEREFKSLLEDPLPTSAALAWANIGLGEIALRRGQAAEAVRRYNEAVRTDAEYASTLAARAGRIKAEASANSAPTVDEAARNFITQLDQQIKTGGKVGLESVIVSGQLVKFIKGIIGNAPEIWQTKVVRTEQLDANHLAADVTINAKQIGAGGTGTAVLILARVGGAWKLESIEQFEVH